MRGWLASPVTGSGTDADPFRPVVFDRSPQEGDRLETAIDPVAGWAIVGYDVADPSDMIARPGVSHLVSESDIDRDIDTFQVSQRNELRRLARREGLPEVGASRLLVRRLGRRLSLTFDERLHLGQAHAPPPGSFLNDTFTDTDGTVLQSHVGELGATWTDHPNNSANAIIKTNRVRGASGGTHIYYASGLPTTAEYDVSVPLTQITALGGGGPAGRMDTAANTFYRGRYNASGNWEIFKTVAGSSTNLGTAAEAWPGGSPVLLFQIRDATKKLFVDGVEKLSSTDNVITAAGRAGLSFFDGTDTTGYHLDSVTASDPSVGGGPPQVLQPYVRIAGAA